MSESVAFHIFCDFPGDRFFAKCFESDNSSAVNGMRTEKILYPLLVPPDDLVDKILDKVGHGSINLIRLLSHGDAGGYVFSGMLDIGVFREHQKVWSRLQERMDIDATLELHDCGVASDVTTLKAEFGKPGAVTNRAPTISDVLPGSFSGASSGKGLRFMRAVREGFNAKVVAPINIQLQLSDMILSWQGDTVTVYPDGRFDHDFRGVRPSDRAANESFADAWWEQINKEFIIHNKFPEGFREADQRVKWLVSTCSQTRAGRKAWAWVSRAAHERYRTVAPQPMHAD